ncbi:lethal(3)malignant brain tumor-like protein 3 isoform X1 [Fukomys damarensis]|uniref:lethal(3)malignant brain tumor-like protein 3 isoform X1 n=2 Tax=Fukomys damarensis TaxID=885580 RepID=UPI00053FBEA1|nr:lethal(3)malignant brain tumor-like protein 3 isoform X1 [Fukomys damarensis]XP_010637448.1 lethal(3)malignant brain tumor-like protein 3 isoform X1 [Fukomys damarensis]XP_010637449.1 lethal(3)malignant brain tumor-like protein 3 isoform X1 [Fukomys damarensis]XP_010637452.1 lethal(3)malignant brain tumor-like protein 3 isoform X1 [Fukomys damarensis]XP_010637453.1 lethal(3)malignant brain tumor-like protein 3 isoform X1 [Fukomys damarensis]XP_033619118.1 lethal(3)malignant brain tumor-like
MTESASSTSGQEFDVFSVMDWKDGVGTLPGSDLKFRVNEFGALEVITDETEMENVKKATATTTWMVPTAQEAPTSPPSSRPVFPPAYWTSPPGCPTVFSEKTGVPFRLKEPMKVDGLPFCENCCQYGSVDECLSGGSFCSQNCARHMKDKGYKYNRDQKEERDAGEDNEEEDSKCSRKKKPKLSMKADPKEDGEEREDEMDNKQDGRILRGSQRARRKRRGDPAVLKQGLPPKGKKSWCWASYLEEEKAVAVPAKLFREHQSFPYNKNGFKVGMKLEGVDPEHQSVYCVLTVAEVCGYRIKLHFDGYSDCYDFWVNADALDIHPVGWCEKTGHKLHPPKGYKEEEFNWQTYLKTCKAQAAPKSLFENQNITVIPSGFRVGMKLEAVDKKNPAFICVATVTDMVDNRFLVHFDNWDESYDYWCEASSPHIHPVGWCKEHRRTLITPPGYPNVKHFSWDKYLEETNSLPAPARAFKVKPPHGFQKKMKLEVVDKRNPVFIRVATVADTDDHRIKVHFDGWSSTYDYWIEADSPDIHPVGWCSKTGHALQPPLSATELMEASDQGGCPTLGCKGIGHFKRSRHLGPQSAASCPYSDINLNKDRIFPDRLSGEMPPANPTFPRNKRTDANESSSSPEVRDQHADEVKEDVEERTEGERRPAHEARGAREESTVQQAQRRSAVFLSFKSPIPCLPLRWEQQSKLLPTVAGIPASKVSKWSTDEVSEFIQSLPGCEEHGKVFKDEQIDGEAFLLMTQTDIVKIMSIKLGPALKIFNSILMFKAAEKNSHNEL